MGYENYKIYVNLLDSVLLHVCGGCLGLNQCVVRLNPQLFKLLLAIMENGRHPLETQ